MSHFKSSRVYKNKASSWNVKEHEKVNLYEYHNYPDAKKIVYTSYWNWTNQEEIFILNKPLSIILQHSEKRWGDLYNACDKLIKKSKDNHNTYIDDLKYNPNTKIIELHTGNEYDFY